MISHCRHLSHPPFEGMYVTVRKCTSTYIGANTVPLAFKAGFSWNLIYTSTTSVKNPDRSGICKKRSMGVNLMIPIDLRQVIEP